MSEETRSFWDKLLGSSYEDEGRRKVREYIAHRVREGAHLRDVIQEGYVRRNASRREIDEILNDPALIESAHEKMREDLSSEELDPKPPPSAAGQNHP